MRQAILLTIILFTLTGFSFGQNKKKPTDTISGLHLSIGIEEGEKSFRSTDVVKINIRLNNIGKSPTILYKNMGFGWSSSLFYELLDKQGKGLISSIILDSQDIPPFNKDDFITLKPQQKIEKSVWFDLKHYNIPKTGIYRIRVWYTSPISEGFAPEGLKIFSSEEGRLESTTAEIKIGK